MRRSARSVISTRSPVSRIRLGISITDSGSVQCTSSRSPGFNDFSALRVLRAGSGHLSPVKSSLVCVMARGWRSGLASSTAHAVIPSCAGLTRASLRLARLVREMDGRVKPGHDELDGETLSQAGIGEKADHLAGFDLCDV